MTSCPIILWPIEEENVETVADFLFLRSKITAEGDCSHEIRTQLLLGRKILTSLDSVLKSKDITLLTKVHIGYDISSSCIQMWELDHKEGRGPKHWCFELWSWRRLLRVPWTARKSNSSILEEINPEYSVEPEAKFQYFCHLTQTTDSLEKTLMLRKIEGRRRRVQQRWDG